MISKSIITGAIASGFLLAAGAIATPASAGQFTRNLELVFDGMQAETIEYSSPDIQDGLLVKVHERQTRRLRNYNDYYDTGYRDVPYGKIRRKLRRRGLVPVSDYRLRNDVVIVRVEDEYGTRFRVVADARFGDIIRVREIRNQYRRPAPSVQPGFYYDDYYRPGYRERLEERRVRPAQRVKKRPLTRAELRAHAKRKAALERGDRQRRINQAAADQRRRDAQAAADQRRRDAQAAADQRRRNAQAAADQRRRNAQAVIDQRRRAANQQARAQRRAANQQARNRAANQQARAQRRAANQQARAQNRAVKRKKLPYIDPNSAEYENWKNGSNK